MITVLINYYSNKDSVYQRGIDLSTLGLLRRGHKPIPKVDSVLQWLKERPSVEASKGRNDTVQVEVLLESLDLNEALVNC